VDALARKRVEIGGQGGDQRLPLAGDHFGDVASVQHHAAHQLDVVVPHLEEPPARLAARGERLGQELLQSLTPLVSHLANISKFWKDKKIIFTEIGYKSINGGAIFPGDYRVKGSFNETQQSLCYDLILETFVPQDWFEGVMWWNWDSNPFSGGRCDSGYTPQAKTTEDVLRKWYNGNTDFPLKPELRLRRANVLTIYQNGVLGDGWENASWTSTVNLQDTKHTTPGAKFSAFISASTWGAIALQHPNLDTSPFKALEFYIFGSPSLGNDMDVLSIGVNNQLLGQQSLVRFSTNCSIPEAWMKVVVPLDLLGANQVVITKVAWNAMFHPGEWWMDEIVLTD